MNYEVAALKRYKFEGFVPDIQSKLEKDGLISKDAVITLNMKAEQESDGTPYGDKADYWYLELKCPGLAPDKTEALKKGMSEVLSAL